MFALDTLMCHIENDLEELIPAKRKKEEAVSSDSEEENSSDYSDSYSSESESD